MLASDTHEPVALDRESFQTIAAIAYEASGLILVEEKISMIQSRLRHRLRDLGLQNFAAYCALVQSQNGAQERRQLISALTTNVSHFFREEHHFDLLRDLLSQRRAAAQSGTPVRVWSAACSNGQEPLSIAMTVRENLPELAQQDFRILATDIDPAVLRFAKNGAYDARHLNGVPDDHKAKYFDTEVSEQGETVHVAGRALRDLIRYNELNLLASWPMKTKFDAIFCRNVVIYFDIQTQERLWPRFRQALRSDGLLFVGHSERIADPERFGFKCIGPTTYCPISV